MSKGNLKLSIILQIMQSIYENNYHNEVITFYLQQTVIKMTFCLFSPRPRQDYLMYPLFAKCLHILNIFTINLKKTE